MRKHLITAAILWLVLTVITEFAALNLNIFPLAAAREAKVVDDAFRTLMILGAPVFAFVIAVLAYSILRFRARGEPTEDGPALFGTNRVAALWLLVTSALAVYVIFNPGLSGLAELHWGIEPKADLVVKVESARWFWKVNYPAYGVTTQKEIVLPVGKHVRVETNAVDVIHSWWVPAFRLKIDSVPGLTTVLYITPDKIASYETDQNMRLQCAELCGIGHTIMMVPVRVVSQQDFDAWVAKAKASQ